jgi:hypothetical protein
MGNRFLLYVSGNRFLFVYRHMPVGRGSRLRADLRFLVSFRSPAVCLLLDGMSEVRIMGRENPVIGQIEN